MKTHLVFGLILLTILCPSQCEKRHDFYPAMRDEIASLYKKVHPWSFIPWKIVDIPFMYKKPPEKPLPLYTSNGIYFDVGLGKRGSASSLGIAVQQHSQPLRTKQLLINKLKMIAQRLHPFILSDITDDRRQSLAHS